MINYADFLNEAKKDEPKKWFGRNADVDRLYDPIVSFEHDDDYVEDDDDHDEDDYYGDEDYGDYGGDDYYGGGYEERFDYRKVGFKPTQEFNKGDVVIYKGESGRRGQKGVVSKIRDDGKIVIRFEDKIKDKRLLAASKRYVLLEKDSEEIAKLETEWKEKKKKEKEEREKELAAMPKLQNVPGGKWWEVNKTPENPDEEKTI